MLLTSGIHVRAGHVVRSIDIGMLQRREKPLAVSGMSSYAPWEMIEREKPLAVSP